MSRRTQLLVVVALVLVAANAAIIWKKFFASSHPHVAKEQQMVEQVLEWESLPATPLDSSMENLSGVIANFPDGRCSGEQSSSGVPVNQLSRQIKDDLFTAIGGLLQCFQRSTPEAVFSYMDSRGEQIDPEKANLVKKALVDEQYAEAATLDSMDNKDLFAAIWDWHRADPKWRAIVEGAGSVCVWRCRSPDRAGVATLGRANKKLFENETNYLHLFRPKQTFEDVCNSRAVLVADVMIVVEHDDSRARDRSPYYIRFWYSPARDAWQPLQLKLVASEGGSVDLATTVSRILF